VPEALPVSGSFHLSRLGRVDRREARLRDRPAPTAEPPPD